MSQTKRALNYLASVALTCLAIFGSHAEACMVCIPLPETTVADALISSEVIVLARENPEKPFSFIAVEVLKGDLKGREIDMFLDSKTRRRLAREPDRAVVLAFGSTESTISLNPWRVRKKKAENSQSIWRSVGYATPAYESLIREILVHAPHWLGQAGSGRRAMYFMPYLSHEERSIRELAYLEVGMALECSPTAGPRVC